MGQDGKSLNLMKNTKQTQNSMKNQKTSTKTSHPTTSPDSGLQVQSSKSLVEPGDEQTPEPTAPAVRPDQRIWIDYDKRQANRALPTKQLLDLLRTEAPRFYELAQVVGKWVWIQFADKQPRDITAQLAQFGFHWNNKRQVWQHPCGPVTVDASPEDPRARYGAFHPADQQPA